MIVQITKRLRREKYDNINDNDDRNMAMVKMILMYATAISFPCTTVITEAFAV